MMKIVHVVESFGGGVYSFLIELCNELCKQHEIIIIHSIREQTPKNFKEDFDKRIKFIKVDMCRGINPMKNIKALFTLKKVLKIQSADIIHLHSSKAGFLGRIACYYNHFDMNKVFYNPHGFSFLQISESKLRRKVFLELEKVSARYGGWIIGCSKGEYNEALKISEKSININNGINTMKIDKILKSIDKDTFNEDNKVFTIGTIGRICYQKNPKQFNEIAKQFPHFKFIWIGDGELREELTASNIQITGWLERKYVLEKLLDLDIYIMTSLWEGLPLSLLEAMYLKRLVVVSDVIGNRDVVIDGYNGYIANETEGFITKIQLLYKIKDKIQKMNENASNQVFRKYNTVNMVKKYSDFYAK